MRVLHVNSGLDPRQGGPTSAMLAMIRAQLDAGVQVSVVSTFGAQFDRSAADQLTSFGAEVTLIGPHGPFLARHRTIQPELSRLVAQADVVHIHAVWEEIQHQAARIARSLSKPYLFTPHGMLDRWSLAQGRWKKRVYLWLRLRQDLNHAAAIHFTHELEREQAKALGLTSPSFVEGLTIDLSDFQPAPPRGLFRARFADALQQRPILLFMGRLHPKKGLDLLLPAFASIAGSTHAKLVIAGPDLDGYRPAVERLAQEHGVSGDVLFTGMLHGQARAEAMVDADLFVLPSYQENFGVVVVEALAVGTPVILSDQVALHRKVVEGEAGEAVPTTTIALAAALARWMGDAALRERASDHARQLVAREFDARGQAMRWLEHYSGLAERVAL